MTEESSHGAKCIGSALTNGMGGSGLAGVTARTKRPKPPLE